MPVPDPTHGVLFYLMRCRGAPLLYVSIAWDAPRLVSNRRGYHEVRSRGRPTTCLCVLNGERADSVEMVRCRLFSNNTRLPPKTSTRSTPPFCPASIDIALWVETASFVVTTTDDSPLTRNKRPAYRTHTVPDCTW